MRKLIYQGYVLTNVDGLTDSWVLIVGEQRRTGSLFELRRQIQFFEELGVLPQSKLSSETQTNVSKKPHLNSAVKTKEKLSLATKSPKKRHK
ncbi:hypothetical protein K0I73_13225 [Shewanella mesophila]|uniref:hypothetical protein n=1 Tax=Shewanella mesophila TaxID=2864208 RepID=UPI001C654EFF|nr:hypothetical protein [Shewanella mesophila]QYJ85169.1 hypothetical protein K0I73_13225 [Shewanella mesophila]